MKIQIFGPPRSGTTSLYEAFRDNINYTLGVFEPLNSGWNYKITNKDKKIEHLKILDKCKLNIVEKNILWEDFEDNLNINYKEILESYISYFKYFDKLIFLSRKNVTESAKSYAISGLNKNWHHPYKDININYTPYLPLFELKNQMIQDLSNYFNTPIIYYEDLYSNNKDYINSFLNFFNIKINNSIQFYFKLNTVNRLKQL